jgi:uncharacterized protein
MPFFVLSYELVPDYIAQRAEFRESHLQLAREALNRGELVLAGALADPSDRALLVFRVTRRQIVEDFARQDPYVRNGLVIRWEVRAWTVVIGGEET